MQKELNDLTKQEFDNIVNTYDNKIGLTNNKIQAFQDQISLLEARGQQVGSALYNKQISLNNANTEKLLAEKDALVKKLAEIPKNTDDWYNAVSTLFEVDEALTQIQVDNANLQKSINQLKFDRFDDLLAKLNDIVDETDFLIDILDSENFFDYSSETKQKISSDLLKYQQGGTVNLLNRPQVDTAELRKVGWDTYGDYATVFSSTYSNENGTIAMNFTPIIADPTTGEYLGALSPDELQSYAESVIAGVRDDNLNLQIGAKFSGDDAIDKAVEAAEKIHELHEEYYSNGITDDGITAMGMYAQKYDVYLA